MSIQQKYKLSIIATLLLVAIFYSCKKDKTTLTPTPIPIPINEANVKGNWTLTSLLMYNEELFNKPYTLETQTIHLDKCGIDLYNIKDDALTLVSGNLDLNENGKFKFRKTVHYKSFSYERSNKNCSPKYDIGDYAYSIYGDWQIEEGKIRRDYDVSIGHAGFEHRTEFFPILKLTEHELIFKVTDNPQMYNPYYIVLGDQIFTFQR